MQPRPAQAEGGGWYGERGATALFTTFLMMIVLSGLALAVGTYGHNSVVSGRTYLLDRKAVAVAEAGWQRARQAIDASLWVAVSTPPACSSPGNGTYVETPFGTGEGEYCVQIIDNGDTTYTITSSGYIPNMTNPLSQRQVVETSVPAGGGSTNQSLNATPTASSTQGGSTPDKAADGNENTKWKAGDEGDEEWFRLDFGTATQLDQMVVKEKKNMGNEFEIEYSNNGSDWEEVDNFNLVESPSETWTADFDSVSARYFRVNFDDVPDNKRVEINEVESYDTAALSGLGTGQYTTKW